MRSKTSYFNPTLFKKNLARFWPLWGGVSLLGALVPLYLLIALIDNGFFIHTGQGLEVTRSYYYTLSYAVPVISLFYAVLCALAVWHYLYNARSVGMYHSLPITRKGLFVTNFLSGMAMMLIPYAVVGGLMVLITLAAGLFEPVGLLITVLGVLGLTFFYFATATVIAFTTGNHFAFAAFYFIFHFLAAAAEWLVSELMTEFYIGVEQAYEGIIEFLSPTIFLIRKLGCYLEYEQIPTPDGWIEHGDLESVTLNNGWLIVVYALAGAVLLGCAWMLYKRRRSESASDVVAVGWMKPVFRYGVALCCAAVGGTMLYALFVESFDHGRVTASAVPMAFCMAIAGVIGYYIASMLLAKSLKVFRGSGKGLLLTAAASAALCFILAADPAGLESWIPQTGDVESVGLNIYSPYGSSGVNVELKDADGMQKLMDLHRAIIAERNTLDGWRHRANEDTSFASVNMHYYLEGKTVHRYYNIPISERSRSQLECIHAAEKLAVDPVIQEESIFRNIKEDRISNARLRSGYVGDVYNSETEMIEGVDLTQEQAQELEAAIKRDIQAGHFGKTIFLLYSDERDKEIYFGSLQLNYNVSMQQYQYNGNSQSIPTGKLINTGRDINLYISVYCTETVKALEDMGVLDDTHKLITQFERDRWQEKQWEIRNGYEDYDYREYPYEEYYPDYAEVVYPESALVEMEDF